MAFSNDCLDTIGVSPNRLRVITFGQCTSGEAELQLIDPLSGEEIDLTEYDIPEGSSSSESSSSSLASSWCDCEALLDGVPKHGVEIVIKEMPNSTVHRSVMAIIDDDQAAEGIIRIPVDQTLSNYAGIWLGMAIVWQHGVMKRHYPFYFNVTPSLASNTPNGPLAMYEVRLAIRDVSPEMNFLLDTVEFKEEEISWAMRRPIDYWNEIPPPVTIFSPITFPFRYHWLNATIGELLKMAAVWMRRNDLDYAAAGLQVQDTKKWPDYMKIGEELVKEYKEFVRAKKIEINIDGAYASLGGYQCTPYR